MTRDEMVALLIEEVKGLTSYLVTDDYENACDNAARETGWAFPISGNEKTYWTKERSKRHIFFSLASESAVKFDAKKFKLEQRFTHFFKLIQYMDDQFESFKDSNPDLFADVSAYKLFGTKIDAGFRYEPQTGRDLTYQTDSLVIFDPES